VHAEEHVPARTPNLDLVEDFPERLFDSHRPDCRRIEVRAREARTLCRLEKSRPDGAFFGTSASFPAAKSAIFAACPGA
jgi:hypothetical protein